MRLISDHSSSSSLHADRKRRSIVVGLGAAMLYGSWAFLANQSHGLAAGLKAAAVQGMLSFVMTFSLTLLIEAAFGDTGRPWMRVLRGAAAGIVTGIVLTVGAHVALGTPELLTTIAPGLFIGTVYSLVYSLSLLRLRNAIQPYG